ncbi:DNA N-6-adenine-methyltransferase (Dam) [Gammaproteobacteria bacterium]
MATRSLANPKRLGYVGKQPGSVEDRDSDSWYTPEIYIQAARAVMDKIDLDPFSSPEANHIVSASRFFDENHSTFDRKWIPNRVMYPNGVRVWMNPPYSSGMISRAVSLFLDNLNSGNVEQAIVLVNNSTETQWFRSLREKSLAVCFTNHRISFESTDGKRVSGNTRGQSFFFFANRQWESRSAAFVKEFSRFGWCISKDMGWK